MGLEYVNADTIERYHDHVVFKFLGRVVYSGPERGAPKVVPTFPCKEFRIPAGAWRAGEATESVEEAMNRARTTKRAVGIICDPPVGEEFSHGPYADPKLIVHASDSTMPAIREPCGAGPLGVPASNVLGPAFAPFAVEGVTGNTRGDYKTFSEWYVRAAQERDRKALAIYRKKLTALREWPRCRPTGLPLTEAIVVREGLARPMLICRHCAAGIQNPVPPKPIRAFADGGVVTPPTISIVGGRDDAIVPIRNGAIPMSGGDRTSDPAPIGFVVPFPDGTDATAGSETKEFLFHSIAEARRTGLLKPMSIDTAPVDVPGMASSFALEFMDNVIRDLVVGAPPMPHNCRCDVVEVEPRQRSEWKAWKIVVPRDGTTAAVGEACFDAVMESNRWDGRRRLRMTRGQWAAINVNSIGGVPIVPHDGLGPEITCDVLAEPVAPAQ